MTILIIGANGKVGRPLTKELLDRGAKVRVLARGAPPAAAQGHPCLETLTVDLANDPLAAEAAFRGVDAVFMLNRPTFHETAEGLFAVEFARRAGVKRFVYQSVFNIEQLAYLPHVAPKLAIQRAVMQSGMEWTVLAPNHFYQNDALIFSSLQRQKYTLPIGAIGCSSVDAGDIAAAAVAVLTGSGHGSRIYPVVGPQLLAGADCAEIWSAALMRPVSYVENLDGWRKTVGMFLPAWFAADLAMMYEDFQRHGFVASDADVAGMQELLGREPRSYQDYVAATAAEVAAEQAHPSK